MKLHIWGGVTVELIVEIAEAMPDSSSEAIYFVQAEFRSLVALGPSFVPKKQVSVWGFQHYLFVGVWEVEAEIWYGWAMYDGIN